MKKRKKSIVYEPKPSPGLYVYLSTTWFDRINDSQDMIGEEKRKKSGKTKKKQPRKDIRKVY